MSKVLIDKWKSQKDNERLLNKLDTKISRQKVDHAFAEKIHVKVFEETDCLQCANCCKSIPPVVSKRDSKRIANHLGLTKQAFAEKYLVTDNDGDTVISSSPCPFLMDDNKCKIYPHRPTACRQYPHSGDFMFYKNLNHHKRNAKYCPALFEILKRLAKIK